MSDLAMSRRAVTRALFLSPAVVAAPATAVACVAAPAAPSAAIKALIADYEAKATACSAYSANIYMPARDKWLADVDAIPHCTTSRAYRYGGDLRRLSTDRRDQVIAAQTAANAKPETLYSAEYAACCDELRELVKHREAQKEAIGAKHGIDALLAEDDRLGELAYQALGAIEAFPAATVSDLLAKIDFIEETGGQLDMDMIRADLRRISGEDVA